MKNFNINQVIIYFSTFLLYSSFAFAQGDENKLDSLAFQPILENSIERNRKFIEAAEILGKLDKSPDNISLLYQLCTAYEEGGDFVKALEVARKIYRIKPSYQASESLAYQLYNNNLYEETLKYFDKALELSPMSKKSKEGKTIVLAALKRWEDLYFFIEENPIDEDAPYRIKLAYAGSLVNTGRYYQAGKILESLYDERSDDGETRLLLGLNYCYLGDYSEGHFHCRAAERYLPGDIRIADCLALRPPRWKVVPDFHYFRRIYSNQEYIKDARGSYWAVDLEGPGQFGLMGEYFEYIQYNGDDSLFFGSRIGAGVYYKPQNEEYVFHFTNMNNNDGFQGNGDIVSLKIGSKGYHTGLYLEGNLGFYRGFSNIQISPSFVIFSGSKEVEIMPMIQRTTGDMGEIRGDHKTRFSLGLKLEGNKGRTGYYIGGWGGKRWLTSKNVGRKVDNRDELFNMGGEGGLMLNMNNGASLKLSLAIESGTEQYGKPLKFYTYSSYMGWEIKFR